MAGFQVVTMGKKATERTDELQARGDYSDSFYSHGLSVQSAEGLAEYVHQQVREELGIGPETGKRYSWGYPACPDLSQHQIVDRLLDLGAIGIAVTEGDQFDPEQTTAALVVPHPQTRSTTRWLVVVVTSRNNGLHLQPEYVCAPFQNVASPVS